MAASVPLVGQLALKPLVAVPGVQTLRPTRVTLLATPDER